MVKKGRKRFTCLAERGAKATLSAKKSFIIVPKLDFFAVSAQLCCTLKTCYCLFISTLCMVGYDFEHVFG